MAAGQLDSTVVYRILESLETIGYAGPLLEGEGSNLEQAVINGLADERFIRLITCITAELKSLLTLNESVTQPTGPEDADSFHLELRAFLSELQCHHQALLGDLSVLNQPGNRLILIDYLLSELMTARLMKLRREESNEFKRESFEGNPYDIHSNLSAILKVYGIAPPPPHVTPTMVLDKIITKTKEIVTSAPQGYLGRPLVTQSLSEEQWGTLDRINDSLMKEYSVRRQMLLTRCSVTVQSFSWSERSKDRDESFTQLYQSKWSAMKEQAPIPIARVLAAKPDLLNIEKTSGPSLRQHTQCDINKVMIGSVPDRGGRPHETHPPPEMPGFRQRTEPPREKRDSSRGGGGGGGGRGGRGRGGGARGGRVQGGWSRGGGGGDYQRSYSVDYYGQQQGWSEGYQGGYDTGSGYGYGNGYDTGRGNFQRHWSADNQSHGGGGRRGGRGY